MSLFIFVFFAVLYVIAGYVSAKCIYIATKQMWLGVITVLMSTTFPFAMSLMHLGIPCNWFLNIWCYIGYISIGFFMYFSMYCLCVLAVWLFWEKLNLQKAFLFGIVGVVMLLCYGYFNATNPRLKVIEIPSDVEAKICFVADIHVGSIGTVNLLNRTTNLINSTDADFVIFGGDTLDLNALLEYKDEFLKCMAKIHKPKLAVIGNHEIYAGIAESIDVMKQAGIRVLLDESQNIGNLTIVGRIDSTSPQRKPLSQIMPQNPKNVIVIDHAPKEINESVEQHAMLHLSGHTHDGQMFPMTFVTRFKYGTKTGVLRKLQNTYCYVTPGAGFWGSPYRIGNHPEVVLVLLRRR
ncbi:MAG: metallophosphoesterase [Alphaproteobacteria bacterium]|nr:metallophosphoesterase [Alphaproteobacteria bacterium]